MDIPARPGDFNLHPERTALLVIDMQNDFGAEHGMFAAAGIDIDPIRQVIAPIARTCTAAREAGVPVIFIKMGFAEDLSDAGPPDGPNLVKHKPLRAGEPASANKAGRVLVRGGWGTEIIPELAPHPGDREIWKTRYSGFFQTDLDQMLKRLGRNTLVVTGCTTSVCVDATLRDAMYRDYRCLILEDCVAEPIAHDAQRSNHEASLLVFELLFAWIGRSVDFIAALERN